VDRYLASFIDHACLCYHEARNVWHLIKAGHVPPRPFELLRTLPTNTFDAWQAMAPLRSEAMASGTAHSASEIFTKRFGLSLDDLAQLYGNPNWRSGGYGGNPGCRSRPQWVSSRAPLRTATMRQRRKWCNFCLRCGTTRARSARSWSS